MRNHPNRSKDGSEWSNPDPQEVRKAREEVQARLGVGITEAQELCANSVKSNIRSWQQWETAPSVKNSHRRMHPAFWELFLSKKDWISKNIDPGLKLVLDMVDIGERRRESLNTSSIKTLTGHE